MPDRSGLVVVRDASRAMEANGRASACRYVAISLRSPATTDKNVHPTESHCAGGLTPHRLPSMTHCRPVRITHTLNRK